MGNNQHKSKSETEPSDLYKASLNGDVETVRRILHFCRYDQLNILEPNGDTALHAACRQGHHLIVYLLLQADACRDLLNTHTEKTAYEEAANDEIRSLFCRSKVERIIRFYAVGYDAIEMALISDAEYEANRNTLKNQAVITSLDDAKRSRYMARFNKSPAILRSIIKAMNERRSVELFQNTLNEVENIRKKEKYDDYFNRFIHEKDLNALLHLYTFSDLFKAIRKHADAYCTLIYLNLVSLSERAYQGSSYRGITMTKPDIARYYYSFKTKGSVVEMRNFSSTSKKKSAAVMFSGFGDRLDFGFHSVLFIYEFSERCPTAIDLSRINIKFPCISEYEDEEEVLILPYTLFQVINVREETETQPFTIHLLNIHVPKSSLLSFITGDIN
ncbi:unnamed protein product [Rotaria sordida]|uniref:NAD(P)(+)--arginine ADP-ribosyltransferase n=1 Tax=Rotaria sordida TaxID=392033 RepID=A0A819Y0F5_9BILA|nr:unnamed protein product [Rotaria sordida]CAF4144901.1 unnamed protein product [Rotaria sordida]